jgi:hypothetical protein
MRRNDEDQDTLSQLEHDIDDYGTMVDMKVEQRQKLERELKYDPYYERG